MKDGRLTSMFVKNVNSDSYNKNAGHDRDRVEIDKPQSKLYKVLHFAAWATQPDIGTASSIKHTIMSQCEPQLLTSETG